jgi:hypothetical protein
MGNLLTKGLREGMAMAKSKGAVEGEPEWKATLRINRGSKRTSKIGAYLTEDGHKRLKTAVLVEGLEQSEILDALIRTYLMGYYSGQRGAKEGEEAIEPDPRVKLVG